MADEAMDRLFGEVDLRLSQQVSRADALGTRSGVMVAVVAVAASVLAGRSIDSDGRPWFITSVVLLGVSVLTGLLVLCMARLSFGPEATQVAIWAGAAPTVNPVSALFAAKVSSIEANQSKLAVVEVLFYSQALTAGLASASALYSVGRFG